jgi:Variant SH3 domain
MALIPASGMQNTFAQQGSLDWINLSRTAYSSSVAVLGRAVSVNVEQSTLNAAQVACLSIPIGHSGEYLLMKFLSSTKAFSKLFHVIWLGTGVRHTVQELVQSAQGVSAVVIAACLMESYNSLYSASVFSELFKQTQGPIVLSPSLSQWDHFVRSCSGILKDSLFQERVHQMCRLAGFTSTGCEIGDPYHPTYNLKHTTPSEDNFAELLLIIGEIQRKSISTIKVHGGSACCWFAVFCDYILGLNVDMRTLHGGLLFQSSNHKKGLPFLASISFKIIPLSTLSILVDRKIRYPMLQQRSGRGEDLCLEPAKLDFARLLYDYSATEAIDGIDLDVKKGDLVAILSKKDPEGNASSWWRCRTQDGRYGYLPSNYLSIIHRRKPVQQLVTRASSADAIEIPSTEQPALAIMASQVQTDGEQSAEGRHTRAQSIHEQRSCGAGASGKRADATAAHVRRRYSSDRARTLSI